MKEGDINYTIEERGPTIIVFVVNERTGESLTYKHHCEFPYLFGYDVCDIATVNKELDKMIRLLR